MPQASLQEITATPAPGTASLSEIQDSTTGAASLGDIATPKVASVADIVPAPLPIPLRLPLKHPAI
jgi:hypothetical protein